MENRKSSRDKAFTHGGVFHADDVFSTAFLRLLNPEIEVERGNCVPENYEGMVFDIGGGEFDHHQKENEIRENGIPYASFGKLWRTFGKELISEAYVKEFDEKFVQKVDLADNSDEDDTISIAISGFRPLWNETKSMDSCFWEAVDFAKEVLSRQIQKYRSKQDAEKMILEKIPSARQGILVLDRYIPYGKLLEDTDIKFVIFPSLRGGYGINNVEAKDGSKKVDFLPEWLGSKDESIGLTFCHKGNFTAAADTLEHAVHIAQMAIDRAEA
jgi:uncharacterized UPF0160 family protein